MENEAISRVVGSFLGAALIIAGLAAFGSRIMSAPARDVRSSVALQSVDVSTWPE